VRLQLPEYELYLTEDEKDNYDHYHYWLLDPSSTPRYLVCIVYRADEDGDYEYGGIDAVFFNWVQTSVRLCVSGSQKFLGKIGLVLKLRDVQICSSFFPKNDEQIFTSLSFTISPILPKTFYGPEPENLGPENLGPT